ncbi:hypothetical protein H2248_011860 [Termitomyces sp. 'cryptogamus']|nr:hypothetical protein H2248_011860 [Termitomyces sp. 'cryptogamus']
MPASSVTSSSPNRPPPTHASSLTSCHPILSSPLVSSPNTALSSTSTFTLSAYTGQLATCPIPRQHAVRLCYAVSKSSGPTPPPSIMSLRMVMWVGQIECE